MLKKILAIIFVDQITKLIFGHRDFFVGPLHVHTMKNFGLSFAQNFGTAINLILIAIGLGLFIYYYWRHRATMADSHQLGFAFVFAGCFSNLFDRAVHGYVLDFLDIGWGFTFNLADVVILVGIILILLPLRNGDKLVK
ncbi:MAG: signal peptidase II [Candidatus Doudnabacteria bacterium]|nr:signal peptidase II [Candidatus Doudnabacteria bacterium]